MQSIGLVRDERAAPLFAYILAHVDHRGPLAPVYLRAIESLGALQRSGGHRAAAATRCTRASGGRRGAPRRCAHAAGGGAGADRHARGRSRCSRRRSRRARAASASAARAHARARAAAAAARPEASRDARRASSSPTNCCAASPRRSDRRSSIRRAIRSSAATWSRCRRRCSCSTACSRRSSSAWSATRSSSTTCRWPRRTRSARSSGGCSRAASSASPSIAASPPRRSRRSSTPSRPSTRAAARTATAPAFPALPHIRVGRVTVEQRVEGSLTDMATFKRLYNDAVSVAERVWDSAQTRRAARRRPSRATMIDGLAQAVAQNRTALLALTTLKNYDNYTFTHMVNVSILTMGQARGARHRRPAAARVRPRRADARHRQGADADRDPEQAGQAHRRRVHDHEAPRRRRRRDPADDAGHPGARAGRRLRAPPADRRHRLSRAA